jgi:hypothetical protein
MGSMWSSDLVELFLLAAVAVWNARRGAQPRRPARIRIKVSIKVVFRRG